MFLSINHLRRQLELDSEVRPGAGCRHGTELFFSLRASGCVLYWAGARRKAGLAWRPVASGVATAAAHGAADRFLDRPHAAPAGAPRAAAGPSGPRARMATRDLRRGDARPVTAGSRSRSPGRDWSRSKADAGLASRTGASGAPPGPPSPLSPGARTQPCGADAAFVESTAGLLRRPTMAQRHASAPSCLCERPARQDRQWRWRGEWAPGCARACS
jgi:hypothetical protein